MIDQRLDDMARGLATNQLSRGQVLKSLTVGLFLGFTGTLSPGHPRAAAAAKPTILRDPVAMDSCAEFNSYLKTYGVTDAEADSHPNWGGATTWDCNVTPKYKAAPLPTTTKGESCLAVTSLTAKFMLPTTVVVIDWKPKEQTPECKAEEDAFVRKIEDHEMKHVQDIAEIERNYSVVTGTWSAKNSPYKACGATQSKAKAKLNNVVTQRLVAKHCPILSKQVEEAEKNFHGSPGGGADPPLELLQVRGRMCAVRLFANSLFSRLWDCRVLPRPHMYVLLWPMLRGGRRL